MANIKSQIKRNRQNEKARTRNLSLRSEVKSRVRRAVEAAAAGAEDTDELVQVAQKRIDMAAAKGAIHQRQAARRKSRLEAAVRRARGAGAEAGASGDAGTDSGSDATASE